MKIETKNAQGEVINEAPEMDLYIVADQVHKNGKVDHINDLREQARAASETKPEEPPVEEVSEESKLTEEDANILANALLHFAAEHPAEEKEEEAEPVDEEETVEEKKEEEFVLTTVPGKDEAPSENDEIAKQEITEEDTNEEAKKMLVSVNPVTGEHVPVGTVNDDLVQDDETFEEMLERVQNSDIKIDDSPFTEEEFDNYIANGNDTLFKEIAKDTDFDSDSIKQLLEVANRVVKKEEFNVYKALPETIQKLINEYCRTGAVPVNTPQGNSFRNMVAEQLMNEFVSNIGFSRIQVDFSKELEEIFDKGTKELSESIVGYNKERSKAYREAADKMEDPVKKEKLTKILDRIDEGYNLTELKEFAKTCKIKKYDLERPDKIYRGFLYKYSESKFNIYGIEMAIPIVVRNINKDAEGNLIPADDPRYHDAVDVNAFFIAFCKQTSGYDPNNNPEDHAYMYYLMYNCVFTDINTGDAKDVSIEFLNNVREVMDNLRVRNDNYGRK